MDLFRMPLLVAHAPCDQLAVRTRAGRPSSPVSVGVAEHARSDDVAMLRLTPIAARDKVLSGASQAFCEPQCEAMSGSKFRGVLLPHWRAAVVAAATLGLEREETIACSEVRH